MKVICIATTTLAHFTIGKVYEVTEIIHDGYVPRDKDSELYSGYSLTQVIDPHYYTGVGDNGYVNWFFKKNFITLKEYRKRKLEKLKSL